MLDKRNKDILDADKPSRLMARWLNEMTRDEKMKLKRSDEQVFQEAIDCMNTAQTEYGHIIANMKQFKVAIDRLEYFKKIAANTKNEEH